LIRIGLNEKQKQEEIKRYVKQNRIKNVIVFSPEKYFMELPELDVPIRQIGYKEIIMYRTFYPLLEEIDGNCLLIANELMRDKNRNCLTYNCYAKYTNQTEHRLVFNYFPVIEHRKDIMVLVDFSNSQRNKGLGLADIDLSEYDIMCVRRDLRMEIEKIQLPGSAEKEYEKERDRLFDELGNKNPDTVPRNLHLWTGIYKKPFIEDGVNYVARNSRFKKGNVDVYKNAKPGKNYILIDMPFRRLDFNDFLFVTGQECLKYMSTGFKVDDVYINGFSKWMKEVGYIYAKTGVYQG